MAASTGVDNTGHLGAASRRGFTPFQALQTATVKAAKALNLDAGMPKAGRLANIVLIDGDPRKDIIAAVHVRQVIANGRPHTVEELLAKAPRKP